MLTMPATPNMVRFIPTQPGETLQHIEIGAGVDLQTLDNHAMNYWRLLSTVDGIMPTNATTEQANPTSGMALAIDMQSRREFSDQIKPLAEVSDIDAIVMSARLLTAAGRPFPTDASEYSIEYHTIPLTPTEQQDLRDQLAWEEEHGRLSPIDEYRRLHPGVDEETALAAIVQARVDRARVDAAVQDELQRRNLRGPDAVRVSPLPADDRRSDEPGGAQGAPESEGRSGEAPGSGGGPPAD
jgi:hypothetical protein